MAVTYPTTVNCEGDDCTWTYEAQDEDDAILAWQQHLNTGCPQPSHDPEPTNVGPDDPIGTVRATAGILAIRANSANPDYPELSWFIIDVGVDDLPANTEDLIAAWPIVYQP